LFIAEKQLPCFPAYTTKLHLAAYFNIGWLIYDTLMADIDPNAIADMYDTSLAWALEMGCVEAIRKLLDAGADPNKQERNSWTALHWAVANGHLTVAELLLQHGTRRYVSND
jgi:ankyrin repeat protein